jgi:osmoprotectant transport system permease protein
MRDRPKKILILLLRFAAVCAFLLFLLHPSFREILLRMMFPGSAEVLYPRAALPSLFGEHLLLVAASGSLALLTGVLLGIAVTRPRGREFLQPVQDLTALAQTFPPVAVLSLAVPAIGFGFPPAFLALFLYSILPVLSNTVSGLREVPEMIKEASVGMGMTPLQVLVKIELPLALPVILAGARTSLILNIGTATTGAVIGAGGLGVPIVSGLVRDNTAFVVEGAVAAAGTALLVDYLFEGFLRNTKNYLAEQQ